jgi:RNA recognition motif. (a.k.a. RRM, RBD, or RNP domain)
VSPVCFWLSNEESACCKGWSTQFIILVSLLCRQSFMQDILNKMVYCVRQGILTPDEASRTIHEAASLLHQPLLNPVPNDTIILSGMRKTVKANDVIRAFRRFGPIDDAAVAANHKGFGLVRFRNPKATQQAMFKYRTSEIVVQDVAVQCKTFDTGER